MIVLGVETSTARSSVALVVDGDVVAREVLEDARGHGAFVAPAMQRCLDRIRAGDGRLGLVAVGIGPGLYTGIRIGVATATAYAAARDVPVVGVCGLDALAAEHGGESGTVVTTLDARRGQVFWAVHRIVDGGIERTVEPRVGQREELDATIAQCAGEGPVRVIGEVAADTVLHPDAATTARLGIGAAELGHVPVPLYLRSADVRIGWATRDADRQRAGS